MKFNKENIKKLREGKATLIADHSKPELMEKVLKEAFPDYVHIDDDFEVYNRYLNRHEGGFRESETKEELMYLHRFFESEEVEIEGFTDSRIVNNILYKNDNKLKVGNIYYCKPKTAEERDKLVKELQAMEFKKELPSELSLSTIGLESNEETLIKLLRMRDVYRDGWNPNKSTFSYTNNEVYLTNFSFQSLEVLNLFLENFREELESVKHLIS